jgi:outer membrane biosynthesis protein TonB
MSAVDSLPGDQRAVLQLILGRRRSYEDIARMLSINPSGVRERALAALDALGPQTRIDQPSRARICDYLLGQLPEGDVAAIRNHLARSAGERAWARVVSSELAPLATEPLPDIPPEAPAGHSAPPASSSSSAMLQGAASVEAAGAAEQAPASEPDRPAAPEQPASTAGQAVTAAPTARAEPERKSLHDRLRRQPKAPKEPKEPTAQTDGKPPPPPPPRDSSSEARSSRLGGLVVIGVVVAIVVVGLVVLLSSGSSKKKTDTLASTPTTAASTTPASATTPPASASSSTTSTTSSAAKVIAQINLTPTVAGSKAAGIAEVLRQGTTNGIAIVAQNVPPNTTHPPNADAVWLYNSPTDAKILGFVNPGVPKSGKLSTAGGLPTNASHYKQLIVTVESSANPKAPGTVILQGTLTGV